MNLVDIILAIILLLAFFTGLKKGLFVALASLVGLIAGVYGAVHFSGYAANFLSNSFNWGQHTTNLAAFAATFFVIVFLISMAGKFLTKIADFAFLGAFNKILGGVFNMLISAFIVSVIFMYINSWKGATYVISEEKKESSILYEPIASLAPIFLPHIINEVKNVRKSNSQDEPEEE